MSSDVSAASFDGHDPRYPIGRFTRPEGGAVTLEGRLEAMRVLAGFAEQLRHAVSGLDAHQLGTPYRDGGWKVLQLVHHIADSHMFAFLRTRLALTEDWPQIKPFDQDGWATLHDTMSAPVELSLAIVEGVHARWGMMLQGLSDEQWQRGFVHAQRGPLTVEMVTLLYSWHSRHHLAHITRLRAERGW